MKNKIISLFLIFSLALFTLFSINILLDNIINYNSIESKSVLYNNNRVSSQASFVSTDFTASKGLGKTIGVYYKNQQNSSVKVTLYKYGWFGSKDNVLVFRVSKNDNKYKEYTSNGADNARYYIHIEASYGDDIAGYLRVNQIY